MAPILNTFSKKPWQVLESLKACLMESMDLLMKLIMPQGELPLR